MAVYGSNNNRIESPIDKWNVSHFIERPQPWSKFYDLEYTQIYKSLASFPLIS